MQNYFDVIVKHFYYTTYPSITMNYVCQRTVKTNYIHMI